ncbi:MAG: class I SAM-dependent methyltransferase [Actinomycetota bacterium]
MPWTFVRPRDATLLAARPLLDLGTGDGQTLRALVEPGGLIVGVDRSVAPMRSVKRAGIHVAAAEAAHLPFFNGSFAVVLAGDLFHHLDDEALPVVLAEIGRVMTDSGALIGWWYGEPGRPGVDAPRYPRSYEAIVSHFEGFGSVEPLDLIETVDAGPPTAGIRARL